MASPLSVCPGPLAPAFDVSLKSPLCDLGAIHPPTVLVYGPGVSVVVDLAQCGIIIRHAGEIVNRILKKFPHWIERCQYLRFMVQ